MNDAPPQLTVLFPSFEHSRREPDTMFNREVNALERLGIPYRVFEVESFVEGDLDRALEFFGEPGEGLLLYRGYILKVEDYQLLNEEIEKRGFTLFTTPDQYSAANLLPEYFPLIEELAIPAAWTPKTGIADIIETASELGPPPWFIKDYVKSAKDFGLNSCIVKNDSQIPLQNRVKEAIDNLLEFRGRWFEGGIVIRPFLNLNYIEESPFGGPTFEEYRLFFFQGEIIATAACGWFSGELKSVADFKKFGGFIQSPFFSFDVVITDAGTALILEMGDGGVSQLPRDVDPVSFYDKILNSLN